MVRMKFEAIAGITLLNVLLDQTHSQEALKLYDSLILALVVLLSLGIVLEYSIVIRVEAFGSLWMISFLFSEGY